MTQDEYQERLNRFRHDLVELLAAHEQAEHGGDSCLYERLNVIGYLAHTVGLRPDQMRYVADVVHRVELSCTDPECRARARQEAARGRGDDDRPEAAPAWIIGPGFRVAPELTPEGTISAGSKADAAKQMHGAGVPEELQEIMAGILDGIVFVAPPEGEADGA